MFRFLVLLVALAAVLIGPADVPAGALTDETVLANNAALTYWRAFALLPKLDEQQKDSIRSALDRLGPVDEKLVPTIDASEASLKELHRAAAMPSCDWGLAVEDGIHATMPHLTEARELSRLACLRAQLRFERGQAAEAIQDATAVMALARHAGSDGLMISILITFAIERQAVRLIAAYLPSLDANARRSLSQRLNELPAGKTAREAILREKEVFLGGFIRDLEKEDGKQKLLKLLADSNDPAVAAIKDLSRLQLLKMAKDLQPVYDRLATVILLPPEKVKQAEEDLLADLHLDDLVVQAARTLTPAVAAVRQAEATHQARLALLKAAIAVARHGRQVLKRKEHQDPFGDGPFKYSAFDGGFELTSKLTDRQGEPVSLTVGRRATE